MKIVNHYIGVEGGYLGDFSYRTHAEFYPLYCDLDIDPNELNGTTRERFIETLSTQDPHNQAIILRGILARFPISEGPETRTQQLHDQVIVIAKRLESGVHIENPTLEITSETVERAIADAETLLTSRDPISGIDRIHTVLHGYLQAVCDHASIPYPSDASLTILFKEIRNNHPKFQDPGQQSDEIKKILRAAASIVDALNPIRNRASIAHPNKNLLSADEAMLVINIVRTLLHYLDSKLK